MLGQEIVSGKVSKVYNVRPIRFTLRHIYGPRIWPLLFTFGPNNESRLSPLKITFGPFPLLRVQPSVLVFGPNPLPRVSHVVVGQEVKYVKAGVSQDSILGPILYNIYTNDVPVSNKTHPTIYADDTAIYSSSWSPRQATRNIQEHLDLILDFFCKWKLRVSPHKTQAITFTWKIAVITEHITIHGHQIP